MTRAFLPGLEAAAPPARRGATSSTSSRWPAPSRSLPPARMRRRSTRSSRSRARAGARCAAADPGARRAARASSRRRASRRTACSRAALLRRFVTDSDAGRRRDRAGAVKGNAARSPCRGSPTGCSGSRRRSFPASSRDRRDVRLPRAPSSSTFSTPRRSEHVRRTSPRCPRSGRGANRPEALSAARVKMCAVPHAAPQDDAAARTAATVAAWPDRAQAPGRHLPRLLARHGLQPALRGRRRPSAFVSLLRDVARRFR